MAFATDFRDSGSFRRDFTVMRPQSGSLALEDGLELVARYGIPGDRWTPVRNLVVLNRPLPRGSFDVEVEVDATFTSPHDDVGILLYGEKGNALYVGHWSMPGKAEEGRRAYLRTVAGGSGQTRSPLDSPASRILSARASSLPMSAVDQGPRAITAAPVRVARSTMAAGSYSVRP